MNSTKDFKDFYQNNTHYFEYAATGILHDKIFAPHRRVHEYVKSLTGKAIGDFGCATGRDIEEMYTPGNRFVGLDVSASALQEARKRFSPPGVSYVEIGFVEPAPLPAESFDVITTFYVFEHVMDPTKSLNEMMRLLKKGGELFIVTPNYGSPLKSAPPLGGPSKKKLIPKTLALFRTMVRRVVNPKASLNLTMIPLDKMDLSNTWESDMDATNEPWDWEIAAYLRAHGFRVESTSWEGEIKTKPEQWLMPLQTLPLIKHFGPLCFIHATKL